MNTGRRHPRGVVIKQVVSGSPAQELGLSSGDQIVALDGFPVADCLSFQFHMAKPKVQMLVHTTDGEAWTVDLEQDPETPFGIALEEDPIRRCRNKCVFCFVDQNPRGVRPSLRIKDEDIRLSFLYGNYTTLTATEGEEEDRIIRERLTPLFVSVHTTNPEMRVRLLRNPRAGKILQQLRRLAAHGIDFHTQIVLCPELNDGTQLAKTIRDLIELDPHILSIAIVPLGLTGHRNGLTELRPVTDAYCRDTLAAVEPIQAELARRKRTGLLFLSDEFYLRAGRPVPPAQHYRAFPQLENGVGMVRRFLDGFEKAFAKARIAPECRGTLATGRLFGPVLRNLMDRVNLRWGCAIQVAEVPNAFFGPESITVTGLLTGSDLVNALQDRMLGAFLILPDSMLNQDDPPRFLDDTTVADIAAELNCSIHLCPPDARSLMNLLARNLLP